MIYKLMNWTIIVIIHHEISCVNCIKYNNCHLGNTTKCPLLYILYNNGLWRQYKHIFLITQVNTIYHSFSVYEIYWSIALIFMTVKSSVQCTWGSSICLETELKAMCVSPTSLVILMRRVAASEYLPWLLSISALSKAQRSASTMFLYRAEGRGAVRGRKSLKPHNVNWQLP